MDEADVPQKSYPLSPAKLSKTPSWIMLGFVLGVLVVLALPPLRKEKAVAPPPVESRSEPAPRAEPAEPPQLSTVEAVFAMWGRYAVWADDTAEVALWNSRTQGFTDYYEVRRFGDAHYFRSLPSLTRRIVTHGKPLPDCPLQFTETEEQYQEWRQHGRTERPIERIRLPAPPAPRHDVTIDIASPQVSPPKLERVGPPLDQVPDEKTP